MPRPRPNARASLAAQAKLMLARLEAEALPLETAGACTPEETERWRKIQMRRLELLIRACWGDAVSGDMGAIEQARRLLGDQIRVMGIEAKPQDPPAETNMDEVVEMVRMLGYEVRRIDDGASRSDQTRTAEAIETSGTDADADTADADGGTAEAEDVAGDGPNQ